MIWKWKQGRRITVNAIRCDAADCQMMRKWSIISSNRSDQLGLNCHIRRLTPTVRSFKCAIMKIMYLVLELLWHGLLSNLILTNTQKCFCCLGWNFTVHANFSFCISFCIQNFPVCCGSCEMLRTCTVMQARAQRVVALNKQMSSVQLLCSFHMAQTYFDAKWAAWSNEYHYTSYHGCTK